MLTVAGDPAKAGNHERMRGRRTEAGTERPCRDAHPSSLSTDASGRRKAGMLA